MWGGGSQFFKDVSPGGLLPTLCSQIQKMSEIDPRGGGVSLFQISLKYQIGGSVKPIWEKVQNVPVF